MSHPQRAERLWLVMTVATLWVLSVGGEANLALSPATLPALPMPRHLSCFVQGLNLILAAVALALPLPVGRFVPNIGLKLPLMLNTYPCMVGDGGEVNCFRYFNCSSSCLSPPSWQLTVDSS